MKQSRIIISLVMAIIMSSCATLTNDPNQQIQFIGLNCEEETIRCNLSNKRGSWTVELPDSAMIRRSDDVLRVECSNSEGKSYLMTAKSKIGAKIIASAVFLDFGIVDAITDKHREYPEQIIVDCKATHSEMLESDQKSTEQENQTEFPSLRS